MTTPKLVPPPPPKATPSKVAPVSIAAAGNEAGQSGKGQGDSFALAHGIAGMFDKARRESERGTRWQAGVNQ